MQAIKEEMLKDYPLIRMEDITDEARILSVAWHENATNWIGDKHKLASDIMNYARRVTSKKDAEISALKSTMIAAAEEIHEHWQAHCDKDGNGPVSLMRRLEEGIPGDYLYTAGRFAEMKKELEEKDKRIAELVEGVERLVFGNNFTAVFEGKDGQSKYNDAFLNAKSLINK